MTKLADMRKVRDSEDKDQMDKIECETGQSGFVTALSGRFYYILYFNDLLQIIEKYVLAVSCFYLYRDQRFRIKISIFTKDCFRFLPSKEL